MKARSLLKCLVIVCALCALGVLALQVSARNKTESPTAPQTALGTAFTYQGQLLDNGSLANGSYDFRFTVYDVAADGSPLAGTAPLTLTAVTVAQGQFTVQLDFGDIFENEQLYLEIAVRPGGSSEAVTTLAPRQAISPVPYARYALRSGSADTAASVPWDGVSDKPADLNWRSLYVPAAALNYTPGGELEMRERGGLRWPGTATELAGFGIPQPDDWDQTTPFTVTLYFALYTASEPGYVRWRLHAGSSQLNWPADDSATGWDQIHYGAEEDAALLGYGTATGYSYLMKSQSWVSKWAANTGSWYFGTSPSTGNTFGKSPMWFFYFERGYIANSGNSNGETYDGVMYVVGAEVTYRAVP
ncbi:MAG TPA: hypothetical protein PKH77_05575 [Anaerolineae bacterium]|nr:hypothetical protein [Anaerolineae bacterium]